MEYEIPKELKEMFKGLLKLYDEAYIELRKEVLYIIKNKIRNTYLIEHTLDNLLNIPTDKCYQLFILLCEYVSTFNKELSDDYIQIYKELYEEDPQIKKH